MSKGHRSKPSEGYGSQKRRGVLRGKRRKVSVLNSGNQQTFLKLINQEIKILKVYHLKYQSNFKLLEGGACSGH